MPSGNRFIKDPGKWYKRPVGDPGSDTGKSIFLDVDGAMSYAIVWLNGHLVGGWPYGYNSWRLNLTPAGDPMGDGMQCNKDLS